MWIDIDNHSRLQHFEKVNPSLNIAKTNQKETNYDKFKERTRLNKGSLFQKLLRCELQNTNKLTSRGGKKRDLESR
jgi:hypothetical protein